MKKLIKEWKKSKVDTALKIVFETTEDKTVWEETSNGPIERVEEMDEGSVTLLRV